MCHRLCLMIRLCLVWLFGPITSADRSCENHDARRHIMYSRGFLSTTTAYKTVAGLLLSILQLSNFNESKPSIVVNNTSLSPCHDDLKDFADSLVLQINCSPLEWWCRSEQRQRYPGLSHMAISILSIPAESSEPERTFSGARRTCSWDRSRLTCLNIEKIECIGS
jgi:hypothetical protein